MKMMDAVKIGSQNWGPLVCQGLYELYKEKIGFNVAIYGSDGGILDAHACVLMAVSPTLKTWLAGDPIQGCHSVEIDTITCDIWTILLDFIYTGTISVDRDMVHEVLNAAEKLQMFPLAKSCKESLNPDKTSNDISLLIPKRQELEMTKSIRSSIMPIQAPQDVKSTQLEITSPADLPPLVSQQSIRSSVTPMQSPRDVKPSTIHHKPSPDAMDQKPAKPDQPLDLTKDVTSAAAIPLPQMPSMPSMSGNSGQPDPQMQTVMAVYYNQMLQYSMLAQKMQQSAQFNPMSKLTHNGVPFPMPPMMPPMMPQMLQEDNYTDGRQRKFACTICGMLFFTRHVKEQHELTHTNLKPYGCSICGFRARQKAVIWRHKKNRHPEADSSVSMDSLTMLPPDSDMADAEDDDEEVNETPCIDSDVTNTSPMQHSMPQNQATANEFTKAATPSANDVSAMMNTDPDKPYPCDTCGRTFKNKYILSQHQMIHSEERRYSCDICGFRAKQMSVIYNHKRNKHFGRKGDDPTMFSPLDTITHPDQLPCVPMEPLSPSDCDKPIVAMTTPGREGSSMTDIEEEVKNAVRTQNGFLCKICNRSLKSKMILQEHIMTHYNIRRYRCCYCNYRAKQRAGLYNHMKVKHKGLKPIWPSKADRSPFKFGSPSVRERLNRSFLNRSRQTNSFHIRMARKHNCRTCGKTFRMKSTLEKHELIHMNIKRFSCKYCGYKSKQKAVIQKHCEKHHPLLKVRMLDLYNENRGQSPIPVAEPIQSVTNEAQDLSQKKEQSPSKMISTPMKHTMPNGLMQPYLTLPIPQPVPMRPSMSPPPITRDIGERNPHMSHNTGLPPRSAPMINDMNNGGVTMLNGNVGILQLELPKSQRDALESPNTNFSSYGTPEKPHRCKTCGRCFRLRHVMEQHELTHFNFRKYMCDICGFRAKQKAVIYRHKKVKHPNHPGAGRVALVPEYGLQYAAAVQPTAQMAAKLSPPENFSALPPLGMMNPLVPPTSIATAPIMITPAPQMKLSPSNNPELAHNNNKGSPQDANLVQDLSIKREEIKPAAQNMPIPMASLLPSQATKRWYKHPSNDRNCSDRSESGDDDDSAKHGDSLATNMAMGLPSMAPASQSFMALPMLAPLSPENNSNSPNGTPDKKYSCQVCGRSFKHRHVLEQHYITHTGLRPYKCEFCDFCARQKASLWRHKQKHLNQII